MFAVFGLPASTASPKPSPEHICALHCHSVWLTELNVGSEVYDHSNPGFDINGRLFSNGRGLGLTAIFQPQQSMELHGRKTRLDHLVEVDPM